MKHMNKIIGIVFVLIAISTVVAIARLGDLTNMIKDTKVVTAQVVTADVNGTAVDLKGYTEATFYVAMGSVGDSQNAVTKFELEVEDSADNSSFTDVTDAELSSSVTATNTGTFGLIDTDSEGNQIYKTTYRGAERYVRVVINESGTNTTGTPFAVIGFGVGAEQLPAE